MHSPTARLTPAQAARILARIDDPVWFTRAVLGDDPWSVPEQIMRAVAKPQSQTAVKACHSSAKTWTAARVVLWWVCTGGIALTTAPTWTQVKRLLWGELHAAYRMARYPLGGTLHDTEFTLVPGVYALGLSTNEGVRFQGFHGRILVVLDEAPGVRPDIWEAIQGIRAGGDVRVLALGNPVLASGPFHDAFTTARAGWTTITIDAFATPNLTGLTVDDLRAIGPDAADHPLLTASPRPYLTTRRWVWERLHEWGEESPLWQARVRGQFPLQSEDALISLGWLELARRRGDDDPVPAGALVAGLDVAGPGEDETALSIRDGGRILAQTQWTNPDPRGDVMDALAPYRARGITVNVDSIGIGYYMAQHIKDAGYAVREINVGERAGDPEKYANAKAEHYWGLRMRFQAGEIGGLTDERAIGQLAGIRYKHNARGQIVIESKDDARKRGVKSPDRAEAVMLAFAQPLMHEITFALPP